MVSLWRKCNKWLCSSMARDLKVLGDVKIFGSFSNGFKTGTSDLEVVLLTKVSGKETVSLLQKFAQRAIEYGNFGPRPLEDKTLGYSSIAKCGARLKTECCSWVPGCYVCGLSPPFPN